jgi:hypothetical protein
MSRYKAYPEYKDSGVEWLGRFLNWSRLVIFEMGTEENKEIAKVIFRNNGGDLQNRAGDIEKLHLNCTKGFCSGTFRLEVSCIFI